MTTSCQTNFAPPTSPPNGLQRTEWYVLFLLEYHAEPQALPLPLTRSWFLFRSDSGETQVATVRDSARLLEVSVASQNQ